VLALPSRRAGRRYHDVMTRLRRISFFVDEPVAGAFHWVLHEATEDASVWGEVEASSVSYSTWIDAFDAGNVVLMRLVDDERIGPRSLGEDEDTAPVG